MPEPFRFKQFTVHQEHAAMKVGTDGVLLGAWARSKEAKQILDIGTGTGVIALQCAQRNDKANITAVEIDSGAQQDAVNNFTCSPWAKRITLQKQSIQNFTEETILRFDHILCNPPFFEDTQSEKITARKVARQQSQLTLEELVKCVKILLVHNGSFSVIYPYAQMQEVIQLMEKHELYLNRRTVVRGRIGAKPKRVLLSFANRKNTIEEDELTIERHHRHAYTQEYINLTKAFYLQF